MLSSHMFLAMQVAKLARVGDSHSDGHSSGGVMSSNIQSPTNKRWRTLKMCNFSKFSLFANSNFINVMVAFDLSAIEMFVTLAVLSTAMIPPAPMAITVRVTMA